MASTAYRAVLFDLDGTLLETVPDLARSAERMLAELRLPVLDEAAVATFVGRGIAVLVERCLKASGRQPDAAQLDAAYRELQARVHPDKFAAATDAAVGVLKQLGAPALQPCLCSLTFGNGFSARTALLIQNR